jgi:hypothetical protein
MSSVSYIVFKFHWTTILIFLILHNIDRNWEKIISPLIGEIMLQPGIIWYMYTEIEIFHVSSSALSPFFLRAFLLVNVRTLHHWYFYCGTGHINHSYLCFEGATVFPVDTNYFDLLKEDQPTVQRDCKINEYVKVLSLLCAMWRLSLFSTSTVS